MIPFVRCTGPLVLAVAMGGLSACDDSDTDHAGSATNGSGAGGSGTAGSGTAGSGTAGSGTAGSGTAGSASGGAGGTTASGCVTDGSLPTMDGGKTELKINQQIDGTTVERRVIVDAPTSIDTNKCYPLLFFFHGNGGSPDPFVSDFTSRVAAGELIGVYPAGHLNSWNLGQEESTADELEFIGDIVSSLASYQNIDNDRRYMAGISNGAGLVHKLAIESNYFRAGAAVVTSLTTTNLPTSSSPKISMLQILGENDGVIPYEGGDSPTGHTFLSGEQSALTWAEHNGCSLTPEVTTTTDGNEKTEYSRCDDNTSVVAFKVPGVGHSIPKSFEGGLMDYIWNFLSTH